ncbi:ferredoxin [Humibacter albus]|jgi:NAD-dependent dihydropyrimidine dehydrogenase PreA subunit|uniref:ferredoxin n=1 Tax=Humibacter albus TaxID=427754 RepID=UPI0003B573B2|nr:ferredoxin [Humibacter albus]
MVFVIAEPCIDVMDRACVDECPVDCIYEGGRSLYIHPDECIDCGACEPVCPVEAIYYEDDLPAEWSDYRLDNARFFVDVLPGRASPLGSPGGAQKIGPLGVDTPLVAAHPVRG